MSMREAAQPFIVIRNEGGLESPRTRVELALQAVKSLSGILDNAIGNAESPKAQEVNARYKWAIQYIEDAVGELALAAEAAGRALEAWGIEE